MGNEKAKYIFLLFIDNKNHKDICPKKCKFLEIYVRKNVNFQNFMSEKM